MSDLRKRFIPLTAFLAFILAAQLAMAASSGKPGSLDPEFGRDGIVPVAIPGSGYPIGMAAASDGSIVVLGNPRYGPTRQLEDDCGNKASFRGRTWQLTRYRRDGQTMSSFGRGGRVIQHFKGDSSNLHYNEPSTVVAQPDGKFLVAGLIDVVTENISAESRRSGARVSDQDCESGFAFWNRTVAGAVRLLPDGRHDRSYGRNGTGMLSAHQLGDVEAAIDGQGGLVFAGNLPGRNSGVMARLTPSGKPDSAFGERGRLKLKDSPRSLAVDRTDRIVAAVGGQVLRFDKSGTPDPTFGANGVLSLGDIFIVDVLPTAHGMTLLFSRKSAATGHATVGVTKLDDSGGALPAFGVGGSSDLGEGIAESLFSDSAGRAVVAWVKRADKSVYHWRVTRLTASGATDPTFDSSGSGLIFEGGSAPGLIAQTSRYGIVMAGRSGTKPGKRGSAQVLARLRD